MQEDKVMDAAELLVTLLGDVDPNEAKKVGQQFIYFQYDGGKMARYLGIMAANPPARSKKTQGYYQRLRDIWTREWRVGDLSGPEKARAWLWGAGLVRARNNRVRTGAMPARDGAAPSGGAPVRTDRPAQAPGGNIRITPPKTEAPKTPAQGREGGELKGKVIHKEGMKVVFELEDGTQVPWQQYGYTKQVGDEVRLRVTKVADGKVVGVRPL